MTITPGANQEVGTVNNCTCSFFTANHSACKHMFLVACRTRFRVSERVDKHYSQGAGTDGYTSSTHAEAEGASQFDSHSQPPLPSHTAETSSEHQQPPYTQEFTGAHNSMAPTPQPSQNNSGDFSLQSYLDMMRGNSQAQTAPLLISQSSAYQPNTHGMLQLNSQHQYRGNNYADRRIFSSNPRLTSTPLDPATVPAEALDVYWDASRK